MALGIVCAMVLGVYMYVTHDLVSSTAQPQPQASAATLREATAFWQSRIATIGPETAYAEFLATAPTLPLATHEQAHAFGEALYAQEGLQGLKYCDSSFEFGCYHSFFGVAVAKEGIDILPKFKDACVSAYSDTSLPCQHGIGHGVLVYTDYENLTEALELCGTISDEPTGGCSSGVFMENNFHTMDESVDATYVRPQTGNLYEPCASLPERFQSSCYLEQVQWWQSIFNSDFQHIGTLCEALPKNTDVYDACFHGIGNYLAANVKLEIEPIAVGCAQMSSSRTQALCHEGASWLVRADGSGIEKAKMVCAALPIETRMICAQKL